MAGLGDGCAEGFDDELLVSRFELREERERHAPVAGVLRDRAHAFREAVALPHVRLKMHGRDVVAGLDPLCGEPLHHGLAVEPAVELDDIDEPRPLVVRVIRMWRPKGKPNDWV